MFFFQKELTPTEMEGDYEKLEGTSPKNLPIHLKIEWDKTKMSSFIIQ